MTRFHNKHRKAFMILVSLNRNNLKTFFALFHPFLYRIQFEPTNTFVCFRTWIGKWLRCVCYTLTPSVSVNLHHFFSLSQVFNLATVDCITKQNRFGKWEQFSWWDSSSFAITITTFRGLKNARKFPLSGRWFQFQIAG